MITLPRLAYSSYFAVKHKVDRFEKWPAWQKVRQGLQAPVYRFCDTGLFGLTPLKLHILICGFQASGTTLLQLMIENGLPAAKRFGKEKGGWRAATYTFRNHEILISKQPQDVLRLDQVREFYAGRNAELKVILMLRDPRDLMTSQRQRSESLDYAVSPEIWRKYYAAFNRERDRENNTVVRYEELVSDVAGQQERIEAFVGRKMQVPFEKFQSVERSDFDITALCGVRPVETSRIARWQKPEHHRRMRYILTQIPDLPTIVQRLGYEPNTAWANAYL